jgi:hypothetical protein
MDLQDLLDGAIHVILARGPTVESFDGERSTGNCVVRRLAKELGELR